ncbi:MAG: ankyrin repeat domain-containing protein [Bacteroidia bacterium]
MKNIFAILITLLFFIKEAEAQSLTKQARTMIIDGDLRSITQLISNGQNINATDSEGRSLLYMAAEYRKFDLVKFLVEKGADINTQDSASKYTPLLLSTADFWRSDSISEYLINKGANPNIIGANGETALRNTIGYGGQEQKSKLFKLLIEKGADINYVCRQNYNSSIFLECCARGTYEMLQLLLDAKININQVDTNGRNGLMYAINSKNVNAINLLIKNGIDLSHRDKDKYSATNYGLWTKGACIIPDGIATDLDKKGRIISETPYKDGKKNGLFKSYYPNGKLKSSIEYKDDKKSVETEYDENEKVKSEKKYD